MCSLEIKLYTFIRQYIFDQSAIMIINHVCIYINLIPFHFHSWGKAISVPYCPDSEVAWTATHTHTHTHKHTHTQTHTHHPQPTPNDTVPPSLSLTHTHTHLHLQIFSAPSPLLSLQLPHPFPHHLCTFHRAEVQLEPSP